MGRIRRLASKITKRISDDEQADLLLQELRKSQKYKNAQKIGIGEERIPSLMKLPDVKDRKIVKSVTIGYFGIDIIFLILSPIIGIPIYNIVTALMTYGGGATAILALPFTFFNAADAILKELNIKGYSISWGFKIEKRKIIKMWIFYNPT